MNRAQQNSIPETAIRFVTLGSGAWLAAEDLFDLIDLSAQPENVAALVRRAEYQMVPQPDGPPILFIRSHDAERLVHETGNPSLQKVVRCVLDKAQNEIIEIAFSLMRQFERSLT